MKRVYRFIILMLIVLNSKTAFALNIEEQISNCKPVAMYGVLSTVDEMDTVKFGKYPQNTANKMEDIEWLVLDRDTKNHKALLLSKYILDNVSFNNKEGECKWEESALRKWTNETFYNKAFNADEKKQILLESHISDSFRDGGKEVSDKVFILSSKEVEKYFKKDNMIDENKRLATRGTKYAQNVDNNGIKLWVRDNTGEHTFGVTEDGLYYEHIVERYKDEALKYEWCIGNSFFWLRTNGLDLKSVARVNSVGGLLVGESNYSVVNAQGGMRPAVWVKYDKEEIVDTENVDDIEIIEFGKYKQNINEEGTDYEESPIEWMVLETDETNKRKLIISKYIIETKIAYNSGKDKKITWESSSMRKWLNETFYDKAFSDEEKKRIKEVTLKNNDNDDYMTLGGKDTVDKVFLLSIDEAKKYFASNSIDNKDQLNRYAATKGTAWTIHRHLKKIRNDRKNEYEEWARENSTYFLRSPGGEQGYVATIGPDAIISSGGSVASATALGVRPAMWIEDK